MKNVPYVSIVIMSDKKNKNKMKPMIINSEWVNNQKNVVETMKVKLSKTTNPTKQKELSIEIRLMEKMISVTEEGLKEYGL